MIILWMARSVNEVGSTTLSTNVYYVLYCISKRYICVSDYLYQREPLGYNPAVWGNAS